MDPDTLEKTSNNMLKVLGSVGRTMEQEVEVEKEEEVDPESIPDEEAEDKAKEEQASQKQKIKENVSNLRLKSKYQIFEYHLTTINIL